VGKIAVLRSIGRAYGFGFGRFGTALAICWLPSALIVAAGFFLLVPAVGSVLQNVLHVFPQFADTLSNDQKGVLAQQLAMSLAGIYRQIILFALICLFLRAMVAVGLTRASVGLEEDGFFYFSLGGAVWKLFGAWLATFLIVYAARVVLTIVAVVIGILVCLALFKISLVAAIGAGVLLYLAVLCVVLYISVRLNFFLPPVIVSEKKLDILRSWTLSEGNVWRIVAIFIAVLPPLLAMYAAMSGAEVLGAFAVAPQFLAVPGYLTDSPNWQDFMEFLTNLLPWFAPLFAATFLLHVLFSAMLYAATARAYRGLVATDIASQTEA
jgi:hypothetical protein